MPPSSNTMASALSIVRTCVLSAQEALCAGSLEPLSQDGGTDTAATAKRQIGVTQDLFRGGSNPLISWLRHLETAAPRWHGAVRVEGSVFGYALAFSPPED